MRKCVEMRASDSVLLTLSEDNEPILNLSNNSTLNIGFNDTYRVCVEKVDDDKDGIALLIGCILVCMINFYYLFFRKKE